MSSESSESGAALLVSVFTGKTVIFQPNATPAGRE